MTNSNLTAIVAVLDRSGSMQMIKTDTEGGFDALIADQAKQPGDCRVTLIQFDTIVDTVYVDKPIADVPPLQLTPRGGTALHDAVGQAIAITGEKFAALDEDDRPGTVIVVILTDGHENSSREWTGDRIRTAITEQTDVYGWQFLFMGADASAVQTGVAMGVPAASSLAYAGPSVGAAFAGTSNLLTTTRSGTRGAYSDTQRAAAAGDSE